MTPVLLDNITHAALHVRTGHGAHLGDAVQSALVVPDEFRQAQAHYPIAFQKSADGRQFQAVALFGLEAGQNLFLDGERWDAPYVPMAVERQPFLIGRGEGDALLVQVDLDHPRVCHGPTDGALPVFLPQGGPSDRLEHTTSLLLALHQGLEQTREFTELLLAFNLLEAFTVDVELADGTQGQLAGYYTIHEERLQALPGAALEQLSRAGYLVPLHMVLASMSRWRDLIERRNRLPS